MTLRAEHVGSFLTKLGKKTFHPYRNSISHYSMLGLAGIIPCTFVVIFLRVQERVLPLATYWYGPSIPPTKCSNPDLVRILACSSKGATRRTVTRLVITPC